MPIVLAFAMWGGLQPAARVWTFQGYASDVGWTSVRAGLQSASRPSARRRRSHRPPLRPLPSSRNKGSHGNPNGPRHGTRRQLPNPPDPPGTYPHHRSLPVSDPPRRRPLLLHGHRRRRHYLRPHSVARGTRRRRANLPARARRKVRTRAGSAITTPWRDSESPWARRKERRKASKRRLAGRCGLRK